VRCWCRCLSNIIESMTRQPRAASYRLFIRLPDIQSARKKINQLNVYDRIRVCNVACEKIKQNYYFCITMVCGLCVCVSFCVSVCYDAVDSRTDYLTGSRSNVPHAIRPVKTKNRSRPLANDIKYSIRTSRF